MRIFILTCLFTFFLVACNLSQEDKEKGQKKSTTNGKRAFYFVRHGQTPWGPEDILKGPQDLELNQIGIQQAEQAGKTFKKILVDFPPAKIITSPLKRAIQTAEKISEITSISIIGQEDGLKERYYGDYRLIAGTDASKVPPDAETEEVFEKRVMQGLYKALSEHRESIKPIILVSHQKVFECVSKKLTGNMSKLSQGGVAHFTTWDDGKTWKLEILDTGKLQ